MQFLFSMLMPFVLCASLAIGSAALWWRSLSSPWAFFLLSILALLGLHRLIQMCSSAVMLFVQTGGYFLEYQEKTDAMTLAMESITAEAIAICVVLTLTGISLLNWLKRQFATSVT